MTTYEDRARWTYAYLNQGEVWFPNGRPRVAISDMDAEWRYNASRFLERTAEGLAFRYTWGEIASLRVPAMREVIEDGGTPMMIGPLLSQLDLMSDAVMDGMELAQDARDHDPIEWVRGTKLYRALVVGLPTKRKALARLAERAKHWSTCPARLDAGVCRCDEIRAAHENAGWWPE